uniref:Bifunctional inhibitor/plant lipid transfer protein/seed storage helical domain-containing protein n=1 Tax=Aegilops tauschii subsp. strangulata TaxID=200361 RepID=A0A453QCK3_AEGTS
QTLSSKSMARFAALLLVALLSLAMHLAPSVACRSCPTTKPSQPPPRKHKSRLCPPPAPAPGLATPTGKCPVDTLKLLACVDVLNGLLHAVIGNSTSDTCCPLLSGVADLDAALCLCTTIKVKALNVSLVLPIAIEVLVNQCGKRVPDGFHCPN